MLYRDPDTGLILRKDEGLLLCNTCCTSAEFSLGYCWCFLNPSPTAWNNYTSYDQYDCVSYGGVNWFSKVSDNINHAPKNGPYWKRYYEIPPAWDRYASYRAYSRVSYNGKIWIWYSTSPGNSVPSDYPDSKWIEFEQCNNSAWNSVPPFGGPNKTPKYYLLTERRDAELTYPYDPVIYTTYAATVYKYIHTTKYDDGVDLPEQGICRYKKDSLVSEDRPVADGWPYGEAGSGGRTGTLVAGQDVFDLMTFLKSTMVDYCSGDFNHVIKGTSAGQAYDNRSWLGDNGTIQGTCSYDNGQWGTGTGYKFTVSWRPMDCNYTQWNTSSNYNVNACVTHNGLFYKCCINNGPGTAHGIQEPGESDPTGCSGSNYWRIV